MITSWLLLYSLVMENRKLTRSLRSLVYPVWVWLFSPSVGGGRGEGGREKVSDKKHIPAILDGKSPQTPLFVYLQAILSFYGHIISPNPQASKNLPEEQIF